MIFILTKKIKVVSFYLADVKNMCNIRKIAVFIQIN